MLDSSNHASAHGHEAPYPHAGSGGVILTAALRCELPVTSAALRVALAAGLAVLEASAGCVATLANEPTHAVRSALPSTDTMANSPSLPSSSGDLGNMSTTSAAPSH